MLVNRDLLLLTRDSFHRFGVTYESNMLQIQYLPTILQRYFLFFVCIFFPTLPCVFFLDLVPNDSCSWQTKANSFAPMTKKCIKQIRVKSIWWTTHKIWPLGIFGFGRSWNALSASNLIPINDMMSQFTERKYLKII